MFERQKFECQNCGKLWKESQLGDLLEDGILERVSPGEIMPYGDCAECGAVCHPERTKEERERDRLVAAAPDLLAALKRAERDLLAIMGDDQNKIDPAFARERIQAAIAEAEGEQ